MNSNSARNRWSRTILFALIVGFALTAGMWYLGNREVRAQQPRQTQLPSPGDLSRAFINVAKQIKAAVVNVDVVEKAKTSRGRRFEVVPPEMPGFPFGSVPRRREGTGSGVIISPDGYILTNNHVAGDADEIKVKLADGRELKATRVGVDSETDLAVIKVEAHDLPFARLGDSDKLEQGEWVIAIGSPFGLQQTMTAGIVSATGRDLRTGQYDNYIQTDASINPGNSGGPLVNMEGEVVGINALIYSQTGSNSGIGFSIPSNLASKVYSQLVKNGKVTRGYLGVSLKPVTPSLANAVGFAGTEGAVVDDLAGDAAPAAKAGLRSGDVIVEFDGKPVKSAKQLTEIVADTPVGKVTQLKYVRDGRAQTATISLAERPMQGSAPVPQPEGEDDPGIGKLGIRASTVNPEVARELKLKTPNGAVIESVQPDSPAADAGLRRGDVIHRINREQITNSAQFSRALAAVRGDKEIVLQIERDGKLAFVTVTPD
jgi:serine protease Do